jgi:hypothetical protein
LIIMWHFDVFGLTKKKIFFFFFFFFFYQNYQNKKIIINFLNFLYLTKSSKIKLFSQHHTRFYLEIVHEVIQWYDRLQPRFIFQFIIVNIDMIYYFFFCQKQFFLSKWLMRKNFLFRKYFLKKKCQDLV